MGDRAVVLLHCRKDKPLALDNTVRASTGGSQQHMTAARRTFLCQRQHRQACGSSGRIRRWGYPLPACSHFRPAGPG